MVEPRRDNKISGFSPLLIFPLGCCLISLSRRFIPPRLSDEHILTWLLRPACSGMVADDASATVLDRASKAGTTELRGMKIRKRDRDGNRCCLCAATHIRITNCVLAATRSTFGSDTCNKRCEARMLESQSTLIRFSAQTRNLAMLSTRFLGKT